MSEKSLEELGIPTPSNMRTGDNFYGNASTSSGQTLAFEPPPEKIELPSHGILYKGATNDPVILEEGSIMIRPMTVHEEKIITTSRLIKSGQALDMVFANCIKSSITPQELLSSDRIYLMLWLRSVSYGNKYKFNLQCPSCQSKFEYMVDLDNHPITEMDDKEAVEPFEFVLPVSKYKVYFRLPRGKDEAEVMKLQNQPKKIDAPDEDIMKRMSSVIMKIEQPDGVEIQKNIHDAFVDSMIGKDASLFRQELIKLDAGVEDITGISCPYCNNVFDTSIPITENFFRTTE